MRRAVLVSVPQFGPQLYAYWTQFERLQIGDRVVVESPAFELLIGTVYSTNPKREAKKANKWLVDKIELDAYRALSAMVDHPEVIEGE